MASAPIGPMQTKHLKDFEDVLRGMSGYAVQEGPAHFRLSYKAIRNNLSQLEDVDEVLHVCTSNGLFNCLALTAVLHDRVEELLGVGSLHLAHLNSCLCQKLLMVMAERKRWCYMNTFLTSLSDRLFKDLLHLFAEENLSDDSLAVFGVLVKRCTVTRVPLDEIVFIVIKVFTAGLYQQFKALICSESMHVQQAVAASLDRTSFLHDLLWQICRRRVEVKSEPDNCLTVAFETGLMSPRAPQRPRPNRLSYLALAVKFNDFDVVRLLCRAGVPTNSQIFQLKQDPVLDSTDFDRANWVYPFPSNSEYRTFLRNYDKDIAVKIREFLWKVASQPRSLQDLCLQDVSKQMGWGHEREMKVSQLEIAEVLKLKLTCKWNLPSSTENDEQ